MNSLYDLDIHPYQLCDFHASQWLTGCAVGSGCSSGSLVSGASCCAHSWAGLESLLCSQMWSLSVKPSWVTDYALSPPAWAKACLCPTAKQGHCSPPLLSRIVRWALQLSIAVDWAGGCSGSPLRLGRGLCSTTGKGCWFESQPRTGYGMCPGHLWPGFLMGSVVSMEQGWRWCGQLGGTASLQPCQMGRWSRWGRAGGDVGSWLGLRVSTLAKGHGMGSVHSTADQLGIRIRQNCPLSTLPTRSISSHQVPCKFD